MAHHLRWVWFSFSLRFKYDTSKPVGSRVFDITDTTGKALDMNKSYTIAVNDYLASGGDDYADFTKGTDVVNTGVMERDFVIQSLESLTKNGSALTLKADNRVTEAKQGAATDNDNTTNTSTSTAAVNAQLPKTGEAPAEVYVVFGGLFAALGAYLLSKKIMLNS